MGISCLTIPKSEPEVSFKASYTTDGRRCCARIRPVCQEARAYSHIDRFCPAEERIHSPNFYSMVTGIQRPRFSSGYAHPRAIVLEAVGPDSRP